MKNKEREVAGMITKEQRLQKSRAIGVWFPIEIANKLEEIAKRERRTKSQIIRFALEHYLEEYEGARKKNEGQERE